MFPRLCFIARSVHLHARPSTSPQAAKRLFDLAELTAARQTCMSFGSAISQKLRIGILNEASVTRMYTLALTNLAYAAPGSTKTLAAVDREPLQGDENPLILLDTCELEALTNGFCLS
jgi:hypothetical protein